MSYEREITIPDDFVPICTGAPSSGPYNLTAAARGILIGTGGTLDVVMRNGATRTGLPVLAGILPGRFMTITGGTAEDLFEIR